jgi:hypothetical protein
MRKKRNTSKLLLHRNLIKFGAVSRRAVALMLNQWRVEAYSDVKASAFDFLVQSEQLIPGLIDIGKVAENEHLSDEMMLREISQCHAIAIHNYLSIKYHEGQIDSPGNRIEDLHSAVSIEENFYHHQLNKTHYAAKNGDIQMLAGVLLDLNRRTQKEMKDMAEAIGSLNNEEKSIYLVAIRCSSLIRRFAMLSAASVLLLFRFSNNLKLSGLRQVADRRKQLRRSNRQWLSSLTSLYAATLGSEVSLSTNAIKVQWVDNEGIGYSTIQVSGGVIKEVRIARRNLLRVGVCEGSCLLINGKIEITDNVQFLSIRFIEISKYARTVWEDYLVEQSRKIYNLYPRSLDMEWEIPSIKSVGARNDFLGRII